MKRFYLSTLFVSAFTLYVQAQTIHISGPAGSGLFGKSTEALANGNYVVTDPGYDEGGLTDIGAVYLYDGITNTLISTLKGSSNFDQVGSEGITALPNGNFVVQSQYWDHGGITDAGAVTWGNGTTGLHGTVNSSNSLVGSSSHDRVGYYFGQRVVVLPNGNYIVTSSGWDNGPATDAGAVTWGDGSTGVSGLVNLTNSLIGSTANDRVGYFGIYVLTNGNYVVAIPDWDNGAIVNAGAVTWGSGATGVRGTISAGNSLVGSSANDNVGNSDNTTRILLLTNGNYVVFSPDWDNGGITNAGAVTWCDGTTGRMGTVSTANSLYGKAGERVGYPHGVALTNGNYVVCSQQWQNGAFAYAGAATWCSGTSFTATQVTAGNSMVGTKSNDYVGNYVVALTNGNYVVASIQWKNGAADAAGAATWGNGATGTIGLVSSANSLVGSSPYDQVGSPAIIALTNGNYLVQSMNWNNGAALRAGAATWGNGVTGTSGVVSAANSLVGSTTDDQAGYFNSIALTNGNYVVNSPYWDNGAATDAGAATWGNGTTGVTGTITAANSLVGDKANDLVSRSGIYAVTGGNYAVSSAYWDNGAAADAGAITLGNGSTGTTGILSAANSVVGSSANDNLGNGGTVTFTGGGFSVHANQWNHGSNADAGAVIISDGVTALAGPLNADNALIGNLANDRVGQGAVKLSPDVYAVISNNYYSGGTSGAVTWVNANTNVRGYINGCNSAFAYVGGNDLYKVKFNPVYNRMLLGKPLENMVTLFRPADPAINNHLDVVTYNINATTPIDFINNNCRLIATVQPAGGATALTGLTAARSWYDAAQSREYVRRHYEIAPANIHTATGRVTLYFTDADFHAFNTQSPQPYTLLPLSTDDPALIAIRKQNLLIERRRGYSTDLSTGAPATYTSNIYHSINPNDADIHYNYSLNRWEVSFDVTGFGGFFVKTVPWILPVQWLHVSARLTDRQQGLVGWQVEEQFVRSYTIEKSTDGIHYQVLGTVSSQGNGKHDYRYTDTDPLVQKTFYRVLQTDHNGRQSYSDIVQVDPAQRAVVSLYPNPAHDRVTLAIYNSGLLHTRARILGVDGRLIKTVLLTGSVQQVNISGLAAGVYQVAFADGSVLRLVKK